MYRQQRFLVERKEAALAAAGGSTIARGSCISWLEGSRRGCKQREYARVLSLGEERDYRAPVSMGDTTRKDYGKAGIAEGTVISLPSGQDNKWYRVQLDKDHADVLVATTPHRAWDIVHAVPTGSQCQCRKWCQWWERERG